MRPILVLAAALVLALPGCVNSDPPAEEPVDPGTEGPVVVTERPETTFGEVETGAEAGPDLNATIAAPPRLIAGEWWRIKLNSPLDGANSEFVRVVAKVEGDTYLFGMPHEGWWKEAVVYHTPAFGEVSAADLSYNTHDELFTPLRFPLTDGDTWETQFSGQKMQAHVTVESDTRARVTFTGLGGGILGPVTGPLGLQGEPPVVLELVYDATVHEVVEFKHGTVTFEVVAHGYGFEGWVTVPRGERLVFFNGRIGGAIDLDLAPAPPVETLAVSGGFNRVSFILASMSLTPVPSAIRITATAPDGTVYTHEAVPSNGLAIEFFEGKDPDGDWTLEYVVAGGAYGFIEGIAYHQYDIRLPDGAIRADHSHEVIR